jgi:hypothetical protein
MLDIARDILLTARLDDRDRFKQARCWVAVVCVNVCEGGWRGGWALSSTLSSFLDPLSLPLPFHSLNATPLWSLHPHLPTHPPTHPWRAADGA